MLTKIDLQQIGQVVKFQTDEAVGQIVSAITQTMASKEDLGVMESRLDNLEVKVDRVHVDLREIKEKVNHIETRLVLPEEINNKELAYA